MKKMFQYLIDGREMVLVTVVASSGAAPRGAGARMIVTEEGRIWGTIGGGAVEYRSEQMAKQVLKDKNSYGHDFSLTKDDVQNLGMTAVLHLIHQQLNVQRLDDPGGGSFQIVQKDAADGFCFVQQCPVRCYVKVHVMAHPRPQEQQRCGGGAVRCLHGGRDILP